MAFPGPPAQIVETHVSVIAMIGDRAYKLLKPVDLGFLDHRRREDRLAACRRETEVNRRFAPDVYPLDEDGHIAVHLLDVPAEHARDAWRGASVCPERAISVIGPPEETW